MGGRRPASVAVALALGVTLALLGGEARAQQGLWPLERLAMLAPDAGRTTAAPERPTKVIEVLRPDEPLAEMRLELPIPTVRQTGDKTNCGPTTAAMTLAAFRADLDARRARELRDLVGEWSWQAFPLRQMRLPGYGAGMTTREMMRQSLDAFGAPVRFEVLEHPWLPLEAWSIVSLKRHLAEHRPVVVLAEASTLWDMPNAPGLHWVVVRGLSGGAVVFNDPADGTTAQVPLERFWKAWRLSDAYRSLPMVAGFEALVADRSLPTRHTRLDEPRPDALPPMR